MEQNPKETPEKNWAEIAEQLDLLQKEKNDGRGVSCVQDIIKMLQKGNLKEARHIAKWDHDKISSYPDIEDFLEKSLLDADPDSPVKTRKRLEEKFGWKKK